jgi:hypothetical protein
LGYFYCVSAQPFWTRPSPLQPFSRFLLAGGDSPEKVLPGRDSRPMETVVEVGWKGAHRGGLVTTRESTAM